MPRTAGLDHVEVLAGDQFDHLDEGGDALPGPGEIAVWAGRCRNGLAHDTRHLTQRDRRVGLGETTGEFDDLSGRGWTTETRHVGLLLPTWLRN
jgi:hypothetical protein